MKIKNPDVCPLTHQGLTTLWQLAMCLLKMLIRWKAGPSSGISRIAIKMRAGMRCGKGNGNSKSTAMPLWRILSE